MKKKEVPKKEIKKKVPKEVVMEPEEITETEEVDYDESYDEIILGDTPKPVISTGNHGTVIRRYRDSNGPVTAKYRNATELQNKVDEYFKIGDVGIDETESPEKKKKQIYTTAGLAYFLGFKSRSSLTDYKNNPRFGNIVSRALLRIEAQMEANLQTSTPTGAIFGLKNLGWSDNQKSDVNIHLHPFVELMKQVGKKNG